MPSDAIQASRRAASLHASSYLPAAVRASTDAWKLASMVVYHAGGPCDAGGAPGVLDADVTGDDPFPHPHPHPHPPAEAGALDGAGGPCDAGGPPGVLDAADTGLDAR